MAARYALFVIHYHNTVSNADEHVWAGGLRDSTHQAFLQTPAGWWSLTPIGTATTTLTPPPTVKQALYTYEQSNSAGW